MRDETFCRVIGNRVIARMPDRAHAQLQDMVAELLCGGGDENDALAPREVARFLRRKPEYVRAMISRLNARVFGEREAA